jgi:hypothetical protein
VNNEGMTTGRNARMGHLTTSMRKSNRDANPSFGYWQTQTQAEYLSYLLRVLTTALGVRTLSNGRPSGSIPTITQPQAEGCAKDYTRAEFEGSERRELETYGVAGV